MRNSFLNSCFLAFLFITLCCLGCNKANKQACSLEHIGDNQMKYSQLLSIIKTDSFTVCELRNPWNVNEIKTHYILVPKTSILPNNLPPGVIIRTPICASVLFSSVHASLWQELNVFDKVAGICDTAFIVSKTLRQTIRDNKTPYAGSSINPNIETLLSLNPDALFISPYEGMQYETLNQVNVPIIECADYMEVSPLARAEWMKFYGELLGKRLLADSLFNSVEKRYNELVAKVSRETHKPRVFADIMQNSIWFVPGGKSTVGQLFTDAGADYIYKHTQESGSLSYNLEKVLHDAENADIWLIKYSRKYDFTYASLGNDNAAYRKFSAYKNKNIWQCNVSYNSYFEDVPFHPERLLSDLVCIFHPSVLPNHKQQYFIRMSE